MTKTVFVHNRPQWFAKPRSQVIREPNYTWSPKKSKKCFHCINTQHCSEQILNSNWGLKNTIRPITWLPKFLLCGELGCNFCPEDVTAMTRSEFINHFKKAKDHWFLYPICKSFFQTQAVGNWLFLRTRTMVNYEKYTKSEEPWKALTPTKSTSSSQRLWVAIKLLLFQVLPQQQVPPALTLIHIQGLFKTEPQWLAKPWNLWFHKTEGWTGRVEEFVRKYPTERKCVFFGKIRLGQVRID